MTTHHITYLYDPLCGWCYGASPVMQKLAAVPSVSIALAPTGLFAGQGARSMDADFAAFAWQNDQRIASATGQPFSDEYRRHVLGGRNRMFDSGPATLALTAVAVTAPERELEALEAIQKFRFVDGRDVTDVTALSGVFRELKMHAAAERLVAPDDELMTAARRRIEAAQEQMRQYHVTGVPTLIAGFGTSRYVVRSGAVFASIEALLAELEAPV